MGTIANMIKRTKELVCILFMLLLSTNYVFADSGLCNIATQAISDASKIRGLNQKQKVPCYVQDKKEIKKYILKTVDEEIPPEKLRNEGVVYKKIGILPKDFDYENGLINAYTSQIGGYYDPKKNHYVMAKWIPQFMQTPVAVHELTHALQDQHYNLAEFTKMKDHTSDELLARSALIEGDATAVMMDYTNKLISAPNLAKQKDVNSIIMQNVLGASMTASANGVPQSLISIMIFPYTSGLRFAHELLKKGSYQLIDETFKKPPKTTAEILHPEKLYNEYGKLNDIDILTLIGKKNSKVEYSDVLGEFLISLMLETLNPGDSKNSIAAEGWKADRIILIDGKVYWLIQFEDLKNKDEFLSLVKRIDKFEGNIQKIENELNLLITY